jgi:hypothetical protein
MALNESGRREVWVPALDRILVCKPHRRASFCGVCLRDAVSVDPRLLNDDVPDIGLYQNEDFRAFPYIQTTCRRCRAAELWRVMSACQADREAVGGGPTHDWTAADLETRQAIELYIDTAEGTLADVVAIAREKYWLLKYTRIADFLDEAVAAHRLSERMDNPDVYGAARHIEDEVADDLDAEDFEDLMMPEHLAQARELAIHDWARTRVLDGHWITPADDWHDIKGQHTRSEHPAPWTLAFEDASGAVDQHPSTSIARVPRAPTYTLADNLHRVFVHVLRKALAPALFNIVKRISLTAPDPALYAARMEVYDVLHELRQPYAWSKTLDVHSLPPLPPPRRHVYKDKDDASSTGSHGSEAETTSPVLTASTLQTTPSPPPHKIEATDPLDEPPSPAESDGPPPPDPTNMVHPIPYMPVSLARMPPQTAVLVQQVRSGGPFANSIQAFR